MGAPTNGKSRPSRNSGTALQNDRADSATGDSITLDPRWMQVARAEGRAVAWARVLDALGKQRAALEWRIVRADPDDICLEHDFYDWRQLVDALTDFLKARGAA